MPQRLFNSTANRPPKHRKTIDLDTLYTLSPTATEWIIDLDQWTQENSKDVIDHIANKLQQYPDLTTLKITGTITQERDAAIKCIEQLINNLKANNKDTASKLQAIQVGTIIITHISIKTQHNAPDDSTLLFSPPLLAMRDYLEKNFGQPYSPTPTPTK